MNYCALVGSELKFNGLSPLIQEICLKLLAPNELFCIEKGYVHFHCHQLHTVGHNRTSSDWIIRKLPSRSLNFDLKSVSNSFIDIPKLTCKFCMPLPTRDTTRLAVESIGSSSSFRLVCIPYPYP